MQDDALTLVDCSIEGNLALDGDGGGIHVAGGGTLTVRGSTFSGNTANWGGAINFFIVGGSLQLENSTISGNLATSFGGGIYFRGFDGAGFNIRNSTITANTAFAFGGGIFRAGPSVPTATLASSIVSGNICDGSPDIFSPTPVTVNFSAIGSNAGFPLTGANNLPFGADLKMAALTDNGGSTKTHELLAGSAAINTGDNPSPLLPFDRAAPVSTGSPVPKSISAPSKSRPRRPSSLAWTSTAAPSSARG